MGRGRKNGSTVPAGETSNQKFVRLAIKRVGSFKQRARYVKNLAAYDFTDEQKNQVVGEILKVADDVAKAFNVTKAKADPNRDSFNFS